MIQIELDQRRLVILDRAAKLGGESYRLRSIAKDDPAHWQRLADLSRERASIQLELQDLYASYN